MSTRALYTFIDPETKQSYHVYRHHDGYPSGAAQHIRAALAYAWKLPRFEADEFAAAFVAANKGSTWRDRELELLREYEGPLSSEASEGVLTRRVEIRKELARVRDYMKGSSSGGGVRLMHSGSVYAVAPADIEYRYEVTLAKGQLHVTAYSTNFWDVRSKASEKRIYKGPLSGFEALEEPGGCGAARLAVLWTAKSSNKKTGPMPVSTTSAETCPSDCPLKRNGCYAETGNLGFLWRALTENGPHAAWQSGVARVRSTDWRGLCANVAALSDGTLWRHNQAGDLPHTGGMIDDRLLTDLVCANRGRRGFTYTHHNVLHNARNRELVAWANGQGFTVNLSGNSLAHADALADLGVGPVVVVLPRHVSGNVEVRTPKGRRVVVCPATYRDDVTCKSCGLCQVAGRGVVVGFPAHGAGARKASVLSEGLAS